MKKMETDAVKLKPTAMYTLVKIWNDVAMRDHDSLKRVSHGVYGINEGEIRWPWVSSCPTGEHKIS